MLLRLTVNRVQVEIDLPGLTETAYKQTRALLARSLGTPKIKNREAIVLAFLYVLRQCPEANPSDLWHHVVYRLYCDIFSRHRSQNPGQSWVRASGEALEQFLQQWYSPVLVSRGIEVLALISSSQKRRALEEMGLSQEVGAAKLDVALYLVGATDRRIFGGIHVKASLAERVSDDVPASEAMMRKGFFSPLWTLDVKSFPPPHGDLINKGELGTPTNPSEKRRYVEEHGSFDNCYSANSRSVPSAGATPSGKRIFTIVLSDQPDQFAKDIIGRATSAGIR